MWIWYSTNSKAGIGMSIFSNLLDLFVGAPTSRHLIIPDSIAGVVTDGLIKKKLRRRMKVPEGALPMFSTSPGSPKNGKKFKWVFIYLLGFYHSSCGHYVCSNNCVFRHISHMFCTKFQNWTFQLCFFSGSLRENLGIVSGDSYHRYIYIYTHTWCVIKM